MGYTNDTHMHTWIPPTLFHYVTGTWADAAGQVANSIVEKKTAADNTATITIPVLVPMNDSLDKGSLLNSIDIYWECLTAANDAVTPALYVLTLPTDTAIFAVSAAPIFTYDTAHNTAGGRLTLSKHKMTLTLATPFWVKEYMIVQVELVIDAALTTVDDIIGARVNYTFRV